MTLIPWAESTGSQPRNNHLFLERSVRGVAWIIGLSSKSSAAAQAQKCQLFGIFVAFRHDPKIPLAPNL
jgi:hypothetical protein